MSRVGPALRVEPLEPRETPAAVGTLDPSFGIGGVTSVNAGVAVSQVAVDSAGRVVMVGATTTAGNHDVVVFRFTANGTPDPSFRVIGQTTIDFGGDDSADGVAIDAQDNIIISGQTKGGPHRGAAFARLSGATGLPDPTFGAGGTGQIVIDDPADHVSLGFGPLAIDAAGRPVAVGTAGEDIEVLRLTANGSGLDPSFNGGAPRFLSVAATSSDSATGLALDAAGRIVFGGVSQAVVPGPFADAVGRLLPDGTPDPAFNGGNILVFTPPGATEATAGGVDVDPAGNVYLAASEQSTNANVMVVARVTGGGALDTTFGTGGLVTINPPGALASSGSDVAVTPAGRIVATGEVATSASMARQFLAAQLLPDGTLDPGFAAAGPTPGMTLFPAGTTDLNQGGRLALAPNGRIVVEGTRFPLGSNPQAVEAFRLIGTVERPRDLSVGGAANATANVYAPTATSTYANPPARTTPGGLFQDFSGQPFTGEVRTATGDVNGDGFEDTVLLTGPGAPGRMAVVSGKDGSLLLAPTDPYGDPGGFGSGGFVTAGDIDGNGRAEWVVTPDLRGGPRVIVFGLNPDGSLRLVANFFGIEDPSFRDGARAALGDVNGDGILDVFCIAAFNGGPRTALFDGQDVLVQIGQGRQPFLLVSDFFATTTGTDDGRGGRSIAAGDVNGDGVADLIATGDNLLGTGNQVVAFSGADLVAGKFPGFGATPLANFTVGGQSPGALVSLATVDADGDNKVDLAVGSGAAQASLVKVYAGANLTGATEPGATQLDPFGTPTVNGVFVG
jgi:uncharacterized delta-60 repeat protein